jgi:type II secretory pathway component PulM
MSAQFEVPRLDDLSDLGIAIESSEQAGIVSLTAWANDGSSVTLTWDEIAGSATVRWLDGDHERLVLERETASKISVQDVGGSVYFRVWSRAERLAGELIVQVGERVSVHDALLRTGV